MGSFSERVKLKKDLDAQMMGTASRMVYASLDAMEEMVHEATTYCDVQKEMKYICDFFGIQMPELPGEMEHTENIMQYVMSETGIMRRKIILTNKWWNNGATPLLCSDQNGIPYAMIPASNGGYVYYENGKSVKLTQKEEANFIRECYCFYQPMENRALTIKDFMLFISKAFSVADVIWLLTVSLVVGLVGMIVPAVNQFIFNSVIPSGTSKEIQGITILLVGTLLAQALCKLARTMWVMRIGNKIELLAQNAIWSRLLSLPVSFFKEYSSGELSKRAAAMNEICNILGGQLIPTLLGSVFSVVYVFQISSISAKMFAPTVLIVICMLLVNIGSAALQISRNIYNNKIEGTLSGIVFELLGGITKIKVAGAEARAFDKWANVYSQLKVMPSLMIVCSGAVSHAVNFGGVILLYLVAYKNNMSASEYIAFNSAFGLFVAAVMSLAGVTSQVASLKPAIDMVRPILEEEPETAGYKKQVTSLSGDIEINQVKFRYHDEMPYVLDGLSLQIKKGEYIGIVGSSGCGKSTLIRVLLGFEKPQSGSVYYDMQDMDSLDLRSVRRRIGVVLQNGKLFSGDIYSNIVICAPWLSVEEAWRAAERSGFAEDIKKMPMGMFTMISEGGGGLSGGQQQRLLIARALASNPDIVMFDEATSALDNITQSIVVKTLESMDCTRLVIAHRLSTIKNCSRIIYLDKGKVVESGTYEELMELDGKFAEMAKRQIV